MRVQSVLGYLFYLFLFNSRLLFFLFDSYGSSIGAPLEHYRGSIRATWKLWWTDIGLLSDEYGASVYDNSVPQHGGVYDHSVPQDDDGAYDLFFNE